MTDTVADTGSPYIVPGNAVRIGFGSALDGPKRRRRAHDRWAEVTIYRTADGHYCAERVARSTVPGEVDVRTTYSPRLAPLLVRALQRPRTPSPDRPHEQTTEIPFYVAAAVAEAKANDGIFARQVADEMLVESYGPTEPTRDDSTMIRRPRTGARSVRFYGRLLAKAEPRHNSVGQGVGTVEIFAVDDGTYAVTIVSREGREPVPQTNTFVGLSPVTLLDALRFRGGYNSTARAALRMAAANDPYFATLVPLSTIDRLPTPAISIPTGLDRLQFRGAFLGRIADEHRTTMVYRNDEDGGYVVGEATDTGDGRRKHTATSYEDAAALVVALMDRAGLLADVATRDAALAEIVKPQGYGEPEPREGSSVIEASRGSGPRVRFCGRQIASATPRAEARGLTFATVTLYAVDDGTYAVTFTFGKDGRSHRRDRAYLGRDVAGVLDTLRFRGGYSRTARSLLKIAARTHPPFAEHLSEADVAALPAPETVLRAGTETFGFRGRLLARQRRAQRTDALFARTDGEGYVLGTTFEGAERTHSVSTFATAGAVVDALSKHTDFLAQAALHDESIRSLLDVLGGIARCPEGHMPPDVAADVVATSEIVHKATTTIPTEATA